MVNGGKPCCSSFGSRAFWSGHCNRRRIIRGALPLVSLRSSAVKYSGSSTSARAFRRTSKAMFVQLIFAMRSISPPRALLRVAVFCFFGWPSFLSCLNGPLLLQLLDGDPPNPIPFWLAQPAICQLPEQRLDATGCAIDELAAQRFDSFRIQQPHDHGEVLRDLGLAARVRALGPGLLGRARPPTPRLLRHSVSLLLPRLPFAKGRGHRRPSDRKRKTPAREDPRACSRSIPLGLSARRLVLRPPTE